MNRWDTLSLQEKNQLLGIYASKGYTDLASIISHYNTFSDGGKLTFKQWKAQMQSKYPDIEMDNNRAGYDYETYFNNHYDDAIKQLSNLQHFPDTYKLPNHPTFSNESIYSRGPVMGGTWNSDDTFTPSVINEQYYPDRYDRTGSYTEQRIYNRFPHQYPNGGFKDRAKRAAQNIVNKQVSNQLRNQVLGINTDSRLNPNSPILKADDDNRTYAERDRDAKIAATKNAMTDFYMMYAPNAQSTDVTPTQVLLPALAAGTTFINPLASMAYGAMFEPMEKYGVYQPVSLGLQKLGMNEDAANIASYLTTDLGIGLLVPFAQKVGKASNNAWNKIGIASRPTRSAEIRNNSEKPFRYSVFNENNPRATALDDRQLKYLENIKESGENLLNDNSKINDYQFSQVFGMSRKDLESNAAAFARKFHSEHPTVSEETVKSMYLKSAINRVIEQENEYWDNVGRIAFSRKEQPSQFIIGPNRDSYDFRKGNFTNKDLRQTFKRIYNVLDSPDYFNRLIDNGYTEAEAKQAIGMFKRNMERVEKVKTTRPYDIHSVASPIEGEAVNGITTTLPNGEKIVQVISNSPELTNKEISTFTHELTHASEGHTNTEALVQNFKWMTPLEHVENKGYYMDSAEQRARGLTTLADMLERGYSLDESGIKAYIDQPVETIDHNAQDLLDNFGDKQTIEFLKKIFSLAGVAGTGYNILSNNKQ